MIKSVYDVVETSFRLTKNKVDSFITRESKNLTQEELLDEIITISTTEIERLLKEIGSVDS